MEAGWELRGVMESRYTAVNTASEAVDELRIDGSSDRSEVWSEG